MEPETERIPEVPAASADARPHPVRVALGWAGAAALVVLVLLAVAVVVVPAVGGGTALTVLSGSMEPALPVGSTVVVRPRPAERIAVGDVITYTDRAVETGETRVVTHRVIGIEPGPAFRTRGDANEAPDPGLVQAVDVRGVQWYVVPLVGLLRERLLTPPGLYFTASGLLLLIGGYQFVPRTYRGCRPRRSDGLVL